MSVYLVGIDQGTTGCKACVFDLSGHLLGMAYREYPCTYPEPGYVEQRLEDVLDKLFESCREAIVQSGVNYKEIAAVGLSTQSNTFCLLDENGNMLHDFVVWNDIRATEEEMRVLRENFTPEEYYHTVGRPITTTNATIAKLLWFKHKQPEKWAKVARVCCCQDFYLRKFGADGYYMDAGSASRTAASNIITQTWSKKHLDLCGLKESQMSELVSEPGRVVGTIKNDISEKTGLPVGCKICVGGIDQNCSTFGGGLVESGSAVMVIGTFGSCFIASDKPAFDPSQRLTVKENQGMGNYTVEAMSSTSGAALRWYRDTCCKWEIEESKRTGEDVYNLIVDGAKSSPVGSNGVLFLPYLQGVSAKQDYRARATFLGMTLKTNHNDMSRAVMEGICFEMLDIVNAERQAGIPLSSIRIVGGAAKNEYWCKMFADIIQVPFEAVNSPEAGCLGAAMYAGVGCGFYSSCLDAANRAVSTVKRFEPNKANADAYQEVFARWKEAYESLKDYFYK